MSENPFQAPAEESTPVVGVLSGQREDLRSVAKYQKGIMLSILVYLIGLVAQFAIPPEMRLIVGIPVILVVLAGTVCVFLLAMKVYGVALGILLGIFTLVPCLGLLLLLLINEKATKTLRSNGIKVGLLGANPADI